MKEKRRKERRKRCKE